MKFDAKFYSDPNHYATVFKRHEAEGASLASTMPSKAEVKGIFESQNSGGVCFFTAGVDRESLRF